MDQDKEKDQNLTPQQVEFESAVQRRQDERSEDKRLSEDRKEGQKKLTPNEIRRKLDERTEMISRRVDAIQQEVSTVPEDIKTALLRNPLVSVAGSLTAGLVVGLMMGGGSKKKKKQLPERHRELVDRYMDTVAEDARRAIRKGEDAGEAIRRVLGKHTPLIVISGDESPTDSPQSFLRQGIDMALKTALGFASKVLIDQVMLKLGLTQDSPAVEAAVHGPDHIEVAAATT